MQITVKTYEEENLWKTNTGDEVSGGGFTDCGLLLYLSGRNTGDYILAYWLIHILHIRIHILTSLLVGGKNWMHICEFIQRWREKESFPRTGSPGQHQAPVIEYHSALKKEKYFQTYWISFLLHWKRKEYFQTYWFRNQFTKYHNSLQQASCCI